MEAKECKEYAARMTEARRREYSKASEGGDRRLRKIAESDSAFCATIPRRGSSLSETWRACAPST